MLVCRVLHGSGVVESAGRRPLLLVGSSGLALALLALHPSER